jgi:hypothetical protein
MIDVPLDWWTLGIGSILPMIVALVRQRFAGTQVGTALLLLLSTLTAVLGEIVVGDGVAHLDLKEIGKRTVLLFVTAWVADHIALRGLLVTGDRGLIAQKVSGGVSFGPPKDPIVQTTTAVTNVTNYPTAPPD